MQKYEKSIASQKAILRSSEKLFKERQAFHERSGKVVTGFFISDLHMPYHDITAWVLLKKLIAHIAPQRGYFSVMNDWNDLSGWSLRFADNRPAGEKMRESDFDVIRDKEIGMIKELLDIAPNLKPVQVLGNHDLRLYTKSRSVFPEISEWVIAEYMEKLYGMGVIQFSRGLHMNWVMLAPDLIWHHGLTASANPLAVAKKHISHFMQNGMAHNVVFGHTHRPSIVEGHSIGYNGVQAVNAPSMCKSKGVPYLKTGFAPGWELGIAICEFYPHLRKSRIRNVKFKRESGVMYALWDGTRIEIDEIIEESR